MARILLSSYGSTGDLYPFLAAAQALRARGHLVRFAVEERFAVVARGEGFPVAALPGDSVADLGPVAAEVVAGANPLRSLRLLMEHAILPSLPGKIEALRAACGEADLLVAAASHLGAAPVAELTGIPWASVVITPATLPSASIAPQGAGVTLPPPLQRGLNRLSWAIGGRLLRDIVDRPVNAVRARFGLPPRRDLLWTGGLSPRCTAVAVSGAFLPPPPDWPPAARVTGFLFWDTPQDWAMPQALDAFLAGDRPVVAITAGSYAPDLAASTLPLYRAGLAAARRSGSRALLLGAPPALAEETQAPDSMILPYAPYSLVFPRCAAVIHHGGIGTIAQCARAGVPMVVAPGGLDQEFNATQVARRGVGRRVARRRGFPARLARALAAVLTESRYRERSAALGRALETERGAEALADLLLA